MFVLIELSVGYKPFPLFNHKHKKSVKLFVQVEVLVKP